MLDLALTFVVLATIGYFVSLLIIGSYEDRRPHGVDEPARFDGTLTKRINLQALKSGLALAALVMLVQRLLR